MKDPFNPLLPSGNNDDDDDSHGHDSLPQPEMDMVDMWEQMAQDIINECASLPLDKQPEYILNVIAMGLSQRDRGAIMELRAQIVAELPPDIQIVMDTLDLIDGHLALRDMADGNVG